MATIGVVSSALSEHEHQVQLRRAVIASTIGTAIEWYDFFLYSVVTGLVFAKLFFPNSDPLVGTLEAFGIYAVGFIARPIGAAIFGHYGDRIGRKSTLIATLMIMGVATFLVALVPTYDSIGIWGAVILTILRFIQGVGVGGEWGGSVLMSMEWARSDNHRGFIASWPQFGVPCGLDKQCGLEHAISRNTDKSIFFEGRVADWRLCVWPTPRECHDDPEIFTS
jgi:MFS family permease